MKFSAAKHEKYFHSASAFKFPSEVLLNLGYCWIENFNILRGNLIGSSADVSKALSAVRFTDSEAFQTVDWLLRSDYSVRKLINFKASRPLEYRQFRKDLNFWMFWREPVLKMYDALQFILKLETALQSSTWVTQHCVIPAPSGLCYTLFFSSN